MRLCGGFHALSVGSMSVSVAKGRLMYPLFTRCWQIGWVGLKATRCDPANRHCGDATERILVGLAWLKVSECAIKLINAFWTQVFFLCLFTSTTICITSTQTPRRRLHLWWGGWQTTVLLLPNVAVTFSKYECTICPCSSASLLLRLKLLSEQQKPPKVICGFFFSLLTKRLSPGYGWNEWRMGANALYLHCRIKLPLDWVFPKYKNMTQFVLGSLWPMWNLLLFI